MYNIKIKWGDPVSGKLIGLMWNLLEIWAVKNDCVLDGKVDTHPDSLSTNLITKRRLGPPRDVTPWG